MSQLPEFYRDHIDFALGMVIVIVANDFSHEKCSQLHSLTYEYSLTKKWKEKKKKNMSTICNT